jgi:hypothetical protein
VNDYANQRRHPRHALHVRCWIHDGRHTLYMRVHDVSAGGLSLSAPVPFAADSEVQLTLELPAGQRLRARGRIVWVRAPGSSGPRMGARFLEIFEGEQHLYKLLSVA